jgi:ArsR family transcriptional regulator, arsenate/arsenite/antimonite-responsive transcriptional repressor
MGYGDRLIDTCQSVGNTGFVSNVVAPPLLDQACCAPLVRTPLSAPDADNLSRTLKALADPTRLRLLSLLGAHDGHEACVCDLTAPLGLTQPTISHHLKVLVDAGLLSKDKRGIWSYYALVPDALDSLAGLLTSTPRLDASANSGTSGSRIER